MSKDVPEIACSQYKMRKAEGSVDFEAQRTASVQLYYDIHTMMDYVFAGLYLYYPILKDAVNPLLDLLQPGLQ